jgi:hypothetical protein
VTSHNLTTAATTMFWGIELKPGKAVPYVPPPQESKLHLSTVRSPFPPRGARSMHSRAGGPASMDGDAGPARRVLVWARRPAPCTRTLSRRRRRLTRGRARAGDAGAQGEEGRARVRHVPYRV